MEKLLVNADFDGQDQQCEPKAHGNSEGNVGGLSEGRSDDDQQYEPRADGNSKGNAVGPTKGSSLTDEEKANTSSSLHLSPNSSAPVLPLMKPSHSINENERGSGTKKGGASRSNRPRKKDAVDLPPQQLNSDCVAITPPRKPRKRAQKMERNLLVARARKRDRTSLSTGDIVETSDC